jgi:putative ABC transport system substrate-binding protein
VEGKNFVLENRFAAEQYERFNALAAELVAAKVDVIVAVTPQAALAAQQATSTIPIVFVVVSDPVEFKIIDSLAHPGHNLTGLANISVDLSAKRLEIFKDAIPTLSKVVLLGNPKALTSNVSQTQHRAAAASLGFQMQEIEASEPNGIESAMRTIKDRGAGLVVLPDSMLFNERKHIAELALAYGMPSVSFNAEMADAGILMSYGASFLVQFRRVALYVDKILNGAKPADLPVEQPVQLELIINSKTARGLHVDIPPSLLARADRVTE